MEIKKIFNNNVVVVEKDGRDQVICGRGIAFSKKIGDKVDEDKITQVFVMKEEKENERFQEIIQNIPLEYIELSNEIIEMIKLSIGQKINDIIYISLSDHIYTAVERAKEGIYMPNTMTFEISHYYENEYRLALKALKMINERFDVDLKEDEAGFMTLHIVNAEEENSSLEETTKVTQIVQEIIKVVRNFYGRDFYEDSVYFYRFITHIKFFARRLVYNKSYKDDESNELLDIIKNKYRNSYNCVLGICSMIKNRYDYVITEEEQLYLTIHVHRIVHSDNNN